MTNGNDSATGFAWSQDQQGTSGLTKREVFAMAAMQGLASLDDKGDFNTLDEAWEALASYSVKLGDALINALNIPTTPNEQ